MRVCVSQPRFSFFLGVLIFLFFQLEKYEVNLAYHQPKTKKMAESVVAQQPQRFYCHKCAVEIENVSSVSFEVASIHPFYWPSNFISRSHTNAMDS